MKLWSRCCGIADPQSHSACGGFTITTQADVVHILCIVLKSVSGRMIFLAVGKHKLDIEKSDDNWRRPDGEFDAGVHIKL